MSIRLRTVALLSILIVAALGAVALARLWNPNTSSNAMQSYLPTVTLPTVIAAGIVDGINPCAFTVLLLFITALTTTLKVGEQNNKALRSRLLDMGSIYIAAIFLTYLALGIGLLKTFDIFTKQHLPARIGALVAVLLGLWMLKDYFLPEVGWRLQAPASISRIAHRMGHKASIPALVIGGFLIGLCTVPCSGAVYLAVLSLLALQPTALLGYGYLLLYNMVFILPLVVILIGASSRPTLNHLAHWNLHHKEWVRLVLGAGVVVMGLLILATV
ncbi:MAG: cytochrome C biogenesis protein [Anaerolineae bacterium]|nr:cytochrome C biogenesis protein [Anaerolineae bacterium]